MNLHDEYTPGEDAQLETLASAVSSCGEKMPAQSRREVRARLMAQIAPAPVPLHKRLAGPVIAFATALVLTGGMSYAAAQSAPGDLLYPVKRSAITVTDSVKRVLGVPAPKPSKATGPSDAGKPSELKTSTPAANMSSGSAGGAPSAPAPGASMPRAGKAGSPAAAAKSGSPSAGPVPSAGGWKKSSGSPKSGRSAAAQHGRSRKGTTSRGNGRERSQSSSRSSVRRSSHR